MILTISITIIFLLLIIAFFQDFKRREIDHWVNILIFITGTLGLITAAGSSKNFEMFYYFIIALGLNFIITQVFYKTKLMGGGDCDLLLALTPIIISSTLKSSLFNLGILILLVFIAGSLYGLIYIITNYIKNFKKVNKSLKNKITKKQGVLFLSALGISIILSILNNLFIFLIILFIIYIPLILISKELDDKLMKRTIKGKELYEGDILTKKITFKNQTFQAKKALTKEEVNLLSLKKRVEIKDGIPFAPSFLIALLIYFLLKFNIINLF